jgi:hypothetical protein
MAADASTNIGLRIANLPEFKKQLADLENTLDDPIINQGFMEAGYFINAEAERRLWASKLGKSKTGYASYDDAFAVVALKSKKGVARHGYYKVGVRANRKGDPEDGVWKLRILQWGTNKRQAIDKKNGKSVLRDTGAVGGTDFFYGAVKATQARAFAIISEAIIRALKR